MKNKKWKGFSDNVESSLIKWNRNQQIDDISSKVLIKGFLEDLRTYKTLEETRYKTIAIGEFKVTEKPKDNPYANSSVNEIVEQIAFCEFTEANDHNILYNAAFIQLVKLAREAENEKFVRMKADLAEAVNLEEWTEEYTGRKEAVETKEYYNERIIKVKAMNKAICEECPCNEDSIVCCEPCRLKFDRAKRLIEDAKNIEATKWSPPRAKIVDSSDMQQETKEAKNIEAESVSIKNQRAENPLPKWLWKRVVEENRQQNIKKFR